METLTKIEKIEIIVEIMNDYEICSNFELDLDSSPVYANVGNTISLIENYWQNCVTVCTYIFNSGNEIDDFMVDYTDLSDELIDEIYKNFITFKENNND